MPLLDLSTFAQDWIAEYGYLGPFVVLILCGFGLPLPEEVSLIGAGLLVHEGHDFWTMLVVCVAGVLGGDAVPYTTGRVFGEDALRLRFVRRLLHPRRFRRLERRFQAHRNWAVFSCRFFPGLRWPTFFLAGSMRMSVARWLALDLAAALIQVPIALYLGQLFGANVDRLRAEFETFQLVAAIAVATAVATYLVRRRLRRRTAQRRRGAAAPRPAEAPRAGGSAPLRPVPPEDERRGRATAGGPETAAEGDSEPPPIERRAP